MRTDSCVGFGCAAQRSARSLRSTGSGYHCGMRKLLLNLRHVPEDEANEVRALLEANAIGFYETPPSRWGITAGGIWLHEPALFGHAKGLLDDYQQTRQASARAAQAAAERDGTAETFWTMLRDRPGHVVATCLAIAFILGLMALPVYLLRG